MNKDILVTRYCPKQEKETTIKVTYAIINALQADYKEPIGFRCKHSLTITNCLKCPIFDDLC